MFRTKTNYADALAATSTLPLVEPGLAEEFGKIAAALKKNPLYPEGISYLSRALLSDHDH